MINHLREAFEQWSGTISSGALIAAGLLLLAILAGLWRLASGPKRYERRR